MTPNGPCRPLARGGNSPVWTPLYYWERLPLPDPPVAVATLEKIILHYTNILLKLYFLCL